MANNNSKTFNIFKIVNYIEAVSSIIISLTMLSFHADISLLAFPLSAGFTAAFVYYSFFKFIQKKDSSKAIVVLKLTQYLPFVLLAAFIIRRAGNTGTPFFIDLVCVVLWWVIFILAFVAAHYMNDKNIGKLTETFEVPKKKYIKPKGGARVIYEILDWVDAIVWSIFLVLIVQIYAFQMYKIPSESMVPTFLVNDKVVVSKIDCGPKFPLTDIGLPDFRKYKKGDTVVIRNPHYSLDRKSEVKTVTSQLISMLTFMTVNLNTDENGNQKADPLVKRVAAVPGEQIVMQDGVLYSRTKGKESFQPVVMDAKYATWNLNSIKPEWKKYVNTLPLSDQEKRLTPNLDFSKEQDAYDKILDFEEERRSYNLSVAEFQAKELARKFKTLAEKNPSGNFEQENLSEYILFKNLPEITKRLMTQKGGTDWFTAFMTSWILSKDIEKDMYEESNFRLNVMTKITFGNLVVRFAELYKQNATSDFSSDSILIQNYEKAELLNWYIQTLLDSRNMPVFPASVDGNPQFIPENCYFMMGDNRFNSLDLRHSYDQKKVSLCKNDSLSVEYYSVMDPVYINKKLIIGKPTFIFLPKNRIGRVR